MYKYSTGSVPPPILGLFKKSNEVYTHFTRNSILSALLWGGGGPRGGTQIVVSRESIIMEPHIKECQYLCILFVF